MDESDEDEATTDEPLGDSLFGRFADAGVDPAEAVREERR